MADLSRVGQACERLFETCQKLMDPQTGCPWDREQTPQTLIPYVLEEAYELCWAILTGNRQAILEELGDLLYQAVIQAEWFRRQNQFDLADVMDYLRQKLIRRHPHVFGNVKVTGVEEVKAQWQAIKAQEKKTTKSQVPLDPEQLKQQFQQAQIDGPHWAWAMAYWLGVWSSQMGLDWPDAKAVWAKVQEEWDELQQAQSEGDPKSMQAELGDLLFSLAQWGRLSKWDPLWALTQANQRFWDRVNLAWKLSQLSWEEFCQLPWAQKEHWYQQAKQQLATSET